MKLFISILVRIDSILHGMVILVNLLSIYVVAHSFHNSHVFIFLNIFLAENVPPPVTPTPKIVEE